MIWRLSVSICAVMFACVCSANMVAVADTILFDDEFSNTDWSTVVTYRGPDGTYAGSAGQELSGGNPDEYRQVYAERDPLTSGFDNSTQVYSFYQTFYDPSATGGIIQIDYMLIDAIQFAEGSNGLSGGSVLPALRQNGNIYVTLSLAESMADQNWTGHDWFAIGQDDYHQLNDFSSHPDFLSSGGLIEFGWFYGVSTAVVEPDPGVWRTVGFDNWEISIAEPEPVGVPEPTSLILLGFGLAGLSLAVRRRKRS